ncbi:hypothetical protein ACLDXX_04785 [Acinetobacter baumannii]
MSLSRIALVSALSHGIFGAGVSIPHLPDCSPFAFSEPSSNQSKQIEPKETPFDETSAWA